MARRNSKSFHIFSMLRAAIAVLTTFTLASCHNDRQPDLEYQLECTLDGNALHKDSATLYVVMEEYGRLLRLATAVNGSTARATCSFRFSGHTDRPRPALLRFAGDNKPFYFVLEGGKTTIRINRHGWQISGGPHNLRYTSLLAHRQRLANEIAANAQHYRHAAADSTLTAQIEHDIAARDSLLRDSLERFTLCITDTAHNRPPENIILRYRLAP